jgi:tetratricopeptide (TPR) repeat protein
MRALGGAVLAIVALVVAGAWWHDRQWQIAHQRAARNQTAAAGLLDQVEAALRAGDAEQAAVPLDEAGRRIDEGGVDDLRPRLARCRTELELLRKLDAIDSDRMTVADGEDVLARVVPPRWAAAFAGYGITPGVTRPDEAARRIADSLVRERLLTSLEVWFVTARRDPALRALLTAADPDEFRDEARATNYQRAMLARGFRRQPLPGAQPVWFAIGHGLDQSVDRDTREQLLLAAQDERPNNFPLLMALAILYPAEDKESAPRGVGWCRAALAVRPRSPVAWNNLGVLLRTSGDLPGALAAYAKAVRFGPGAARVYTNLGHARHESGDKHGAVDAFAEAARLRPDAIAYYNLGKARRTVGDLEGAVNEYRDALHLKPDDAPTHVGLGLIFFDQKKLTDAITHFRAATDADPEHPNAHGLLGYALQQSGDIPGARAAFTEAARLNPKQWGPFLAKLPTVAPAPREVIPR